MKKEGIVLFISILIIISIFPLSSAVINATLEKQKINEAYTCLKGKVNTSCDTLTAEERIFSLLAVNQCRTELLSDSFNEGECWPTGNCRLKTTAQAVIALDNSGSGYQKAQSWLLNQSVGSGDLAWFLEIESPQATSCTISYADLSFNLDIGEDKKLSDGAGSCLTLAEENYWLRISPSCFEEEFEISCDQGFLTSLLFRKSDSSTVHVYPVSSSASAGGTTTEKVDSLCFAENNVCSYEGTLWAVLALDSVGEEISSYLPYLLTVAEDNKALLPDSFLYAVTSDIDHRTALLSKQKSKKWWSESGNKFYDTALALYPFQKETLQEKTNAKEWLLSVQDINGCWENNIINTAFILNSVWPRSFSSGSSGGGSSGGVDNAPNTFSCEDSGYTCTTSSLCGESGGNILSEFNCPSPSRCCSVQPQQPTCAEQSGDLCSSNERCVGGTGVSAGDLRSTEICCAGGGAGMLITGGGTCCTTTGGVGATGWASTVKLATADQSPSTGARALTDQ